MSAFASPESYVALLTLTAMEIVLGIDNVVFISILVGRMPPERRERLRRTGLLLALGMRIGLLLGIEWIMGLTDPVVAAFGHPLSGRDLILLVGGAFLVAKSTREIHHAVEHDEPEPTAAAAGAAAATILLQIVLVDVVFSLDSVITAVGMVDEVPVMIVAMLLAVAAMMVFAAPIGEFVHRHPTVKVLALAFLILIGVMLVAEGLGQHVSKGYVYFAMAFSLVVEMLNLRARARRGSAGASP
ncbi:MAG: TerC family protein [Polyangiales bacterium]